MIKSYKFNRWDYSIEKCKGKGLEGYGFQVAIYKNLDRIYTQSGYGSINSAEVFIKKYIIENEHNINLDEEIN